MKLMVNEIFCSIQGETKTSGFPSLFIRLTGCNLNCSFCDTPEAKTAGTEIEISKIVETAKKQNWCNHITITGGEPLCQENSIQLMQILVETGLNAQLETNGSLNLKRVPDRIRKIADVKTPSSSEGGSFLMENLEYLTENDELKFVVSDINDYNFTRDFIKSFIKKTGPVVNISPAFGVMEYPKLAQMMLNDRLDARLNIQLHKIIWSGMEKKIEIFVDK